ncbi:MAG: hypothetical protein ABJB11_05120 [Ferruginibacter sp.]
MPLQFIWLFVLPIPVACVAWTVTHEEVFRELREYCKRKSEGCATLLQRKFFYLFTCEYCFSHYVTLAFILLTGYKLLLDDWRGYIIAAFSVVWIANIYMSIFGLLRQNIKLEKIKNEVAEVELDTVKESGHS